MGPVGRMARGPVCFRNYNGAVVFDGATAEVWRDPDDPHLAYIASIRVRGELRGAGRGTRLLAQICRDADAAGLALTVLPLVDPWDHHSAPNRRIRAWYARQGFLALPPNRYGQIGMRREPQPRQP